MNGHLWQVCDLEILLIIQKVYICWLYTHLPDLEFFLQNLKLEMKTILILGWYLLPSPMVKCDLLLPRRTSPPLLDFCGS